MLVHALASVLCFALFLRPTSAVWSRCWARSSSRSTRGSSALGLIPGRNDSLLAVFVFAAWLAFLSRRAPPAVGRAHRSRDPLRACSVDERDRRGLAAGLRSAPRDDRGPASEARAPATRASERRSGLGRMPRRALQRVGCGRWRRLALSHDGERTRSPRPSRAGRLW